YPNIARLAAGATFYRNYTAVGDLTSAATAAMLSGRPYHPGLRGTAEGQPDTLFNLLGRNGYRVDAHEEVSAFCPRSLCPHAFQARTAPEVLHVLFAGRRLALYDRWLASVRPTSRPHLFYAHLALPHLPLEYFPDGLL